MFLKRWIVILTLMVPTLLVSRQDELRRGKIADEEYRTRRDRLASLLDSGSVLVMKAADVRNRSNDVNYRYRQESSFLYLTGIQEPGCYLLLVPRGATVGAKSVTSILFLPPSLQGSSSLRDMGPEEAILSADNFADMFRTTLERTTTLYFSAPDIRFANDWVNGRGIFLEREMRRSLEEKYPDLKVRAAAPLVAKLRIVKSKAEVQLIQTAINITGAGLRRAISACRPGKREYELQAEIEYAMLTQGAEYPGFPSIIGSGENSLILHYDKNRRAMKAGDVVLMDVGAEFQGYSADITRTIPASGRFTPAQREVYSVVLRAQQATIAVVKPGLTFRDLDNKTKEVISTAGYGKYIKHSVSHPLGLDVHDVVTDTLKAGMVITVEPGVYIPADAAELKSEFRGFGIRIEDDVLVTETGHELLSRNIPREINELERLQKK